MRRKGEITVFLTLILLVLASFVIMLFTSARRFVIKSESESAVDMAVRSCFAEYNRTLFERFHLTVIDSSYKGMDNGIDRIRDRFMMYLDSSLSGSNVEYVRIDSSADAGRSDNEYLYDMAVRYERNNSTSYPGMMRDTDDSYFLAYLLEVFGNYSTPSDKAVRIGEIEYLLYGFEDDEENIRLALSDFEECEDETYEEYLADRLREEGKILLCRRFGDIVTEYMRSNDSPGFDLGECYHRISFTAGLGSAVTGDYEITREYAYEDALP